MGEFRIGRAAARHAYPDRLNLNAAFLFARNFAYGPLETILITPTGVQVMWGAMDVGTAPSEDVPITPKSTGIVRISGVVTVYNPAGEASADVNIHVEIRVNGIALSPPDTDDATVLGEEPVGAIAIPFLGEATGLTVGTTYNVEIFVSAAYTLAPNAILGVNSCQIELQEVIAATG